MMTCVALRPTYDYDEVERNYYFTDEIHEIISGKGSYEAIMGV